MAGSHPAKFIKARYLPCCQYKISILKAISAKYDQNAARIKIQFDLPAI
jgi:hypothetical protein